MFATISLQTAPTAAYGYATFRVSSLPGATCQDYRADGGWGPSNQFTIGAAGYYLPMHGGSKFPSGTYTFYTRCTLSGVTVQSTSIKVTWP